MWRGREYRRILERDYRFHEQDILMLTITLDTESIALTWADCKWIATILAAYDSVAEFEFVRTPSSKTGCPVPLRPLDEVTFESPAERFSAVARTSRKAATYRPLPEQLILQHWQVDNGDEERKTRLLLALEGVAAHMGLGQHVFATENQELLSERLWIEGRTGALTMSLTEAREYMNLYLMQYDKYYVQPHLTVNRGLYYLARMKQSFQALHSLSSAAVYGKAVIPNGEYLLDYLGNFSQRAMILHQIVDNIGVQFYQIPNNDTQDEMLYHLNFLVPLVTGMFDTLAWITDYRYNLNLNRRQVVLRVDNVNRPTAFVNQLAHHNQQLANLLLQPDVQSLINLFYPIRDSIQHRLLLKGLLYINADEIWACNLVTLTAEAAQGISAADARRSNSPFSQWGLLQMANDYCLEPYTFALTTLDRVRTFCNEYLQDLEFEQLIANHPDIQAQVQQSAVEQQNDPTWSYQ